MPREIEYHDPDDGVPIRRRTRRRTVFPVWAVVVLCAAPVVLCGGLASLIAVSNTSPAGKTYTRDEFRKMVLGKTPDEVIKAVGRPDSTSEWGNRSTWTYRYRTVDPVTGHMDPSIRLYFYNNQAESVNY